jgi:hypothetical protein
MRGLRAALLGCLVLLAWGGMTQPAEEKEAVPVIEVETPTHDFNQVPEGQVVRHDFKVFNRGTASLEIKKVKPG